ncbi:MAG: hypothetical protein Kow0090_21340 [Myxococcota bacterium]
MAEKSIKQIFQAGLHSENPIFVLLLGMCPTLAVSTSAWGGLGMGIATTFVLIGSSITVSLIKSYIPKMVRIPAYIMVIATFVTAVDLLLNAYLYDLHKILGIFIPLIVVNCIVLGRAEAFASRQPIFRSATDAAGMGLGFTFALFLLGAAREFIATGMITVVEAGAFAIRFSPFAEEGIDGAVMMLLPPGAFIMLGLIVGIRNVISNRLEAHAKSIETAVKNAQPSGIGCHPQAHIGRVTSSAEGYARVVITRRSACESSHKQSLACASCRGKETTIIVEDSIGVKRDERVEIGLRDEGKVLAMAALGYLMPAASVLVGALTGGEWGAVAGLSGSLLIIAFTAPYLKEKGLWARIKRVERNGVVVAASESSELNAAAKENAVAGVKELS